MTLLHIDFETRSTVDLKKAGLDVYSRDATTDVWCMAWAIDESPVRLLPVVGNEHQASVENHPWTQHIKKGLPVIAHNAAFELAIWNNIMVPRYGWPQLMCENLRCTMASAYAMALPGSLENASAAVGLETRKDQAGRRVMLQLSRPKSYLAPAPNERGVPEPVPVWHSTPEKLEQLYAYCKQDVEVERALHKRLLCLSPAEENIWRLDQAINQRGVFIDKPAVEAAIRVVESEQIRLNAEMRRVTGNAVATCSAVSQLGDWIKWQGVEMEGVAKADVIDALAGDLPEPVRAALRLRQEAAKSSTAKLKAMLEAMSVDGRVKGIHQYHGASTGRWAGRRIQPQNLQRPTMVQADIDDVLDALPAGATAGYLDLFYGQPMHVLANCMRGFITAAPGHELIASDFANIEGRVLAWLAGEEWKLQAFKDYDAGVGPDLYLVAAATAYRVLVESLNKKSPERQPGKVMELAFGFGGALGAWRKMEATAPGMPCFTDDEVQGFKHAWREKHAAIVSFWYALEDAAQEAVLNPGATRTVRGIAFKTKGSFLFCKLPSGRLLCYPYPKMKEREMAWGDMKDGLHYMTVDSTSRWVETHTYGGKLAENVTQAVARDLLADALVRLEADGYPVVMHVHDEAVVEIEEDEPSTALDRVNEHMAQAPQWAAGLPIAVEGWRGKRYRK